MYQINAFVEIEAFILNGANQDALVGELSTQSKTYSRDIGIYTNPALPQYTLNAFTSAIVETGKIEVPNAIRDRITEITDWIYEAQNAVGSAFTREGFLTAFTNQFSTTLSSIDCGDMVLARAGVMWPEWVGYSIGGLASNHVAVSNKVMCWYADDSFQRQFQGFSHTVVPPLVNIDSFFSGRNAVKLAIDAMSQVQVMARVQNAKNGDPESIISAESYDYVNPANSADRIPTNWYLLIYGKAGNDEDAIRQSVRDYISANSTRTESEWRAIFPDIYKTTEFVIFPRWKNWAVEDRVQQSGVYSPIVKLKKELDYVAARFPAYTNLHIQNNTAVIPTHYKSLAAVVLGSPDNRNGKSSIEQEFPDLINTPTSDIMFALQAPKTREWVLLLQRMLMEAEKATLYSDLPNDMRKVTRLGVIYVVAKYDNVTYLVSTRLTTPSYS